MRAIISAIALVFAIGVALPTPTDARPPRKVQKWGCTFKAWGINAEAFPGMPVVWYGGGDINRCERTQRLVIRVAIMEDIPGAPNRVHNQRKVVRRHRKGLGGIRYTVDGGECPTDGSAPTEHPVYLRMQVKRPGKPGVVRVASRNVANICRGLRPLANQEENGP